MVCGNVKVTFHAILPCALLEGEWRASCSGHFVLKERNCMVEFYLLVFCQIAPSLLSSWNLQITAWGSVFVIHIEIP
jgi:hypothetical protein